MLIISNIIIAKLAVLSIYLYLRLYILDDKFKNVCTHEKNILYMLKSSIRYSKSKASTDYSNISIVKEHVDNGILSNEQISNYLETLLSNASKECDRCCGLDDAIYDMKSLSEIYNVKICEK